MASVAVAGEGGDPIAAAAAASASEHTTARRVSGTKRRLRLGTFSDIYDPRLILPMSSAYLHGLSPVVLGLGNPITWGTGMGLAWNTYRNFVFNETEPEDVVLLFDAYDVMFQAGEQELLSMYDAIVARTGRQIIYNADLFCSSEKRKAEHPPCETPWCYLNSGIYMGTSSALRRLFKDPLTPKIKDKDGSPKRLQNHHIDFFLDNQDIVALDSRCELTMVILDIPGIGMQRHEPGLPAAASQVSVEQGRLRNLYTNTTPLILHFPGPGHWPDPSHPERTGTCFAYEFLREAQPKLLSLMEQRGAHRTSGGQYYGMQPWKPVCTFYVTPFDQLAVHLNRLGDAVTWAWFNIRWLLIALVLAMVYLVRRFGRLSFRRLPDVLAMTEIPKTV